MKLTPFLCCTLHHVVVICSPCMKKKYWWRGRWTSTQDPITDQAVQLLKFCLIRTKTIFDKQKRSIKMKFHFTSDRFFNCHTNQSDFTIFHHSWNQTKFQLIFCLLDEAKNRLIFFCTRWQPLMYAQSGSRSFWLSINLQKHFCKTFVCSVGES